MISHGLPMEYWKRPVCETGFSHLRVCTLDRRVELRTLVPNLAKSLTEDERPPDPSAIPEVAYHSSGLTMTLRDDRDCGTLYIVDFNCSGFRMVSWLSVDRGLPVMFAIAAVSRMKPLLE